MPQRVPTSQGEPSPGSPVSGEARDEPTAPFDVRPKAPARSHSTPSFLGRLAWITSLLFLLLAFRYVGPRVAEEIEYHLTRGRQRAEVETAAVRLGDVRLDDLSKAYRLVSQRVGPSVVHIGVVNPTDPSAQNIPEGGGYSKNPSEGQGSGVIVDPQGYILTNGHVIQYARGICVSLSDGRTLPAEVVGEDTLTDLAVLKIEASGLTAVAWGDSDRLEVGELVWAMGSPYGLEHSITSGILSGKHRVLRANRRGDKGGRVQQDFLQTDAAVNPGNSGGPLVDAKGRLVGINTAIVGESYQGISFSVPSRIAKQVYDRIREYGYVPRGWLGVTLDPVTPGLARELDLPRATGAYVLSLYAGNAGYSPAGQAGIRPGDVVLRWNGEAIDSPSTLIGLVGETKIGSSAQALVFRQGRERSFSVRVGERRR